MLSIRFVFILYYNNNLHEKKINFTSTKPPKQFLICFYSSGLLANYLYKIKKRLFLTLKASN